MPAWGAGLGNACEEAGEGPAWRAGLGNELMGNGGRACRGSGGAALIMLLKSGRRAPEVGENATTLITLAALPCLPFVQVVLGMAKVASPEDLDRQKGAGALGEAHGGEGRGGHELGDMFRIVTPIFMWSVCPLHLIHPDCSAHPCPHPVYLAYPAPMRSRC